MIKEFVLSNGLNLLVKERKDSNSVAILISINFGSIFEKTKHSGIAHLIEHMAFTGTKKRNKKELAEEIDKIGGKINAFTSNEMTCFFVEVQDKHFGKGLDVLQDCLNNSLFKEKNLKLEKKIVLREISQIKDNVPNYLFDLFQQLCFKDNKMKSIIGTKKTVKGISRKNIIDYFNEFYTPSNIIVSVVGNINPLKVKKKIEESFSTKKKKPRDVKEFRKEKITERNKLIKRELSQAHLIYGFQVTPSTKKEHYIMEVINAHLGGGLSSRLMQEIREKRGLAYAVQSHLEAGNYFGYFAVYVGARKEKIPLVKELIEKEIKALREKKLTKEELNKAKQYIEGKLLLTEENNFDLALNLINYKRNKVKYTKDFLKRIHSVTSKQVQETAKNFLKEKNYTLIVMKPKK
ncbi:MAG: pitrilysin family protein [archaeon]|nr:insulinase family protein [Candidatus Micrarchaeota archaeon]